MGQYREIAGRIMVALDYGSSDEALKLLDQLQGIPCYVKVGMQLFYSAGPQLVSLLKERGYKVFLDLKMHDIPNTVKGGAESITRLGVDMFNIHAAGGKLMMEYAMEGVDKGLGAVLPGRERQRPIVIAVTQLTSTSQAVLNDEIGIAGSLEDSVLHYARMAKDCGLQGVVSSPREVVSIKKHLGASFITVTPGIRPEGFDHGDQSRVMTPGEAIRLGTDFMVIGRPITAAEDPRKAIETIIEQIIDGIGVK